MGSMSSFVIRSDIKEQILAAEANGPHLTQKSKGSKETEKKVT